MHYCVANIAAIWGLAAPDTVQGRKLTFLNTQYIISGILILHNELYDPQTLDVGRHTARNRIGRVGKREALIRPESVLKASWKTAIFNEWLW